ncbi:hypothetical protein QN277_009682 [Acacia crassicarpa]|uniref:Uncharacterized protein n=1 Tax=Acacia crassicarpa TaxID=499986 RepID=A0AAE1IRN9_9FABA|nr:hypothetical protein QN277_009682 [Acacia crassicarpa]
MAADSRRQRGEAKSPRNYSLARHLSRLASLPSSSDSLYIQRSNWLVARCTSNASFEMDTNNDVVRFSLGKKPDKDISLRWFDGFIEGQKRKVKMSRKAKMKELRFYRLKVKKKMNSPNPEVRIRFKLEKARQKQAWLIEKLLKFEVPKTPSGNI